MQIPQQPPPPPSSSSTNDNTKTTLFIILTTSFFSLLFIFTLSSYSFNTSSLSTHGRPDPYLFPNRQPTFTKIPSDPTPPSIAYLISGSKGDLDRVLRLLYATYHPKNQYLLHLDLSAPQTDRDQLALSVQSVPIFKAAQNVNVIGKADFAYPKGSSTISATLHGAAILLRLPKKWDWFVNLGAADYPLVTPDDLLHILSYLPKDLNFVNHSSYIGWRESRQLKPIIVDPGLYLSEKSEMFYATQKRDLPNSFRLFTAAICAAVDPVAATGEEPILELYMHDILGGSNPTARPITGLLGNIYSGQVPFARPIGFVPPNGVAIPNANGVIPTVNGINGIPLGTGLAGTTFAGQPNGQILNGNPQTQLGPDGLGLGFGTITVIDDILTSSPELGSQSVGKAQGVYVASSADGSTQMMAFTAMFEGGEYGDSLNFYGIYKIGSTMSRLSVTGGTGKFKNARGFAEVRSLIPSGQHFIDGAETLLRFTVHLSY